MNHHKNTPKASGASPTNNRPKVTDALNYRSTDGAVEIHTKVTTAHRYPPHHYPVVCLQLRPKRGSRVQLLDDGSGGLDVLLTHAEVAAHIKALQIADPKHGYQVPDIKPKPEERKRRWDEINRARWENRKRAGK